MKLLAALALVVAACSSSSPAPATPPQNQEPTPAPGPGTPPPAEGPGIGEPCGEGDACATGLTCVSYYGIAGPRGPQFKSCEIKCSADTDCPKDRKCATVADGPGQVCR